MTVYKDYILFVEDGQVCAASGPPLGKDWPPEISIRGATYLPLEEDTFFFWNELRNERDETIGFTFLLPESPAFRHSDFLRNSDNVIVEREEASVLLQPCLTPREECVQGFGSEIYARVDDPRDCVVFLSDWLGNPIGFALHTLP